VRLLFAEQQVQQLNSQGGPKTSWGGGELAMQSPQSRALLNVRSACKGRYSQFGRELAACCWDMLNVHCVLRVWVRCCSPGTTGGVN
jgi:hypothetical protein